MASWDLMSKTEQEVTAVLGWLWEPEKPQCLMFGIEQTNFVYLALEIPNQHQNECGHTARVYEVAMEIWRMVPVSHGLQ